ncbi:MULTISPECIES: AAA family ATPase [unclassified Corallococcus]|uniref:AAA family ATPase n=1 Tax=unclassified Corallococcus TaxID=2685029 RepID=UPI001A8DDD12|nr:MULTISPECIES: adenylate/guanylate cyclase domain-containing protein [unclassified Corallococcus]MBN9684607.1 AAA family ATPase [Corallococcus sp. NCSPR001]WAS83921.1 AAA family ATPase [Corallococcus sp. NCRR]
MPSTQPIDPAVAMLAPYMPAAILARLGSQDADALPRTEGVRGAILLLDIAGFTPIVVGLSGAGPRGIDALQRLLTNYYTEMIDVVRDHGGDIYQFAGDSILACFEAAPGEADADVVQRAAVCALHVQRRLARFARLELLGQRFGVSSRIGIGFGEATRIVMGATGLWMHPALVGEPLAQAVGAEKQATVSEVVLSSRAWAALPESARKGEPREGGNHRLALDAPVESVKRPLPAPTGGAELVGRCALLLHPVLFTKITTAHQEFAGDFRDVTCFFVRFTHAQSDTDPDAFTHDLNAYYEYVQRESAHHGGVLLMTDFTDKGNVLYVLFGAPTAQQNKEVLACRLACKLLKAREQFPFLDELQIGIATGHAYCGDMGSPTRKGYSALGEVVNMAARLMTHGGRQDGVHLCANTQARSQQGGFATEFVEDAKLKGVSRSVPVYRLLGETRRGLFIKGRGDIIGRSRELNVLHEALNASFAGQGRVSVVSGEAGIGKSRLGARVLEDAEEGGARSLYGVCYSYEAFTPFFPWKEVLLQAFGLHDSDDTEAQLGRLRQGLDGLEDVGPEWIPVVAGILGIALEETSATSGMDARRKQQKVFQIVFLLLEKLSRAQPLLLFFEDLHWADYISLDLLQYLAVRVGSHRIMVLATMRPGDQLRGLRDLPEFLPVDLSSLDDEDTRALLRVHLRLTPPDVALEDRLLAKVQGNPFFIESIVEGLAEQGYLGPVEPGSQRMELKRGLQDLLLPDSIQDVVLSRIDLLSETEKLVVKVASVIGRIFTLDAVAALVPTLGHTVLREAMDTLQRLGLILLETEEPYTCLFKHIVIRDVAYNTLLVSAREDLHRRLARYLEARANDNLAASAGLLAFHFLAGNVEDKGLEYTLMAARSARAQYANDDALYHYNRGLELLGTVVPVDPEVTLLQTRRVMQELAETLLQAGHYTNAILMFEQCLVDEEEPPRQAQLHLGLGRAHQEKGESALATQHLEKSLVLRGRSLPGNLATLGLRTLANLLLRGLASLLPFILRPLPAAKLGNYLQQLSTLNSLIRIYYFADITKLTWATLVSTNMAERSRSDYAMSLARGYYGTLLFGAGLLGRARYHCEKALEYARRSKDPVAEGLALSRLGIQAFFANELERARAFQEEAVSTLRQVGERWERQTSLMMQATGEFLHSRFRPAVALYEQMGTIGVELNALMHQGWAHSWAPMCRYLMGEGDVGELCAELEQGLRISEEVADLANQCASLNHLANVTVREHQVEEAALVAVRCFKSIWSYQVLVPFLQVGLVDAAEAALFALEEGATVVPRKKLLKIVRLSCIKARVIARLYPYLKGPALRVTARSLALRKGPKAAEPVFLEAISVLEKSPNRWETGVAYFDAAVALPDRREDFLARARAIFTEVEARAELRRLDRFQATLQAPPPEVLVPPQAARAHDARVM